MWLKKNTIITLKTGKKIVRETTMYYFWYKYVFKEILNARFSYIYFMFCGCDNCAIISVLSIPFFSSIILLLINAINEYRLLHGIFHIIPFISPRS
jgi:hypothetical protein